MSSGVWTQRLVHSRVRLPELGATALVGLVFAFIYLPTITIAVYSFNRTALMSWPPSLGSFHWYHVALTDPAMLAGLENSAIVAVASTLIALGIGVPAGFAFDRTSFPGKTVLERILMMPFFLPGAITGLALLTMFVDINFQLSLTTVIIGHATMLVAVFIILMLVGLARWDRTLEAAAADLGASDVKIFWTVVLPNFRNTIVAGILLALTVSLDEIARTFFLSGTQNTLPMVIWSIVHRSLTPEINAMATLIVAGSLLVLALVSVLIGDGRRR